MNLSLVKPWSIFKVHQGQSIKTGSDCKFIINKKTPKETRKKNK